MAGYWPTAEEDPNATPVERRVRADLEATPKVVFSTTLTEVDHNSRLVRGDVSEVLARAATRSSVATSISVARGWPVNSSSAASSTSTGSSSIRWSIGSGTPFFPPLNRPLRTCTSLKRNASRRESWRLPTSRHDPCCIVSIEAAAILASIGFLVIAGFQVALALGAPWGRAAWGGKNPGRLPENLRRASAVSAVVWLVAPVVVLDRAGIPLIDLPDLVSQIGTWAIVAVSFVGALVNFASSSPYERFGWGPFALVTGLLTPGRGSWLITANPCHRWIRSRARSSAALLRHIPNYARLAWALAQGSAAFQSAARCRTCRRGIRPVAGRPRARDHPGHRPARRHSSSRSA